ncbi:MAG: dicarboxylate/amino acid:cation symporter [Rikenellaceae bacterium]|nr:dicarboxylate/amino acid:cation symporter [Rikenellaceae bacterium]
MSFIRKTFALPLYIQILLGMILGVVIGMLAIEINGEKLIRDWLQPFGRIFIRFLQLIAIPLVFISLTKGVLGLKNIHKFSAMGGRTIILYLFTTVFAVTIGLSMAYLIKPGNLVDKNEIIHIQKDYESIIESNKLAAEQITETGSLGFLEDIVPENIIGAMSDNSGMLQIIFFAVFFSLAALMLKEKKIKPVIDLFDSFNDIIFKMVDIIIRFSPIGVAALMAGLVIDFKGSTSLFSALGMYALTVTAALFILILIFYPLLIKIFTKIKPLRFLRAIYPVQLFAFTTSSSAATLPLTLETVERELNVSQETASFVIPVGATINMDGTSCYQTVATIFIAQVLGIDLTIYQILIIIATTVLSSIGTPAIPGGSFVILTMVLSSVGIPAEGLALILGIDRPLDMLRTAVNVTGDTAVCCIVDKKQ